jgi:threonine synthase
MRYINTNGNSKSVSFREALLQGQAPDKGLYIPSHLPQFNSRFFSALPRKSFHEIALEVARPYVEGDIPEPELKRIIEEALSFPVPLKQIEQNIFVLELFHGPTLAFKDVGARFMAGCMSWFNRGDKQNVTILVATSGDTGSAVAQGFLEIDGIRVVILYPKEKVSEIQEKQFTTLGRNITTLEVDGTFDDCQRLVKTAFADPELHNKLNLSSANSINIGRLLPQSFYYYYGWSQLDQPDARPMFCVPSGNFGNLTAGLMAHKTGLPVSGFVAATNANKVFPDYLKTGIFTPRPSLHTLSNAMDVGNPSNLARINHLYDQQIDKIRNEVKTFSADDTVTKVTMRNVYHKTGYLLDPHSAIGYLGIKEASYHGPGIFLATAHPAKFGDIVKDATGQSTVIPDALQTCLSKDKKSIPISGEWEEFRTFLRSFP